MRNAIVITNLTGPLKEYSPEIRDVGPNGNPIDLESYLVLHYCRWRCMVIFPVNTKTNVFYFAIYFASLERLTLHWPPSALAGQIIPVKAARNAKSTRVILYCYLFPSDN